jgi:hypothetical protein
MLPPPSPHTLTLHILPFTSGSKVNEIKTKINKNKVKRTRTKTNINAVGVKG